MPSLKALEEFRTSFRSIGNEVDVFAQQNLPGEDLELPDAKPAVPAPAAPSTPASGNKDAADDIDFTDFVNTSGDMPPDIAPSDPEMTEELGFPDIDNPPAESPDEENQVPPAEEVDDFSLENLPGFTANPPEEHDGVETPADIPPEEPSADDFSLDNLADIEPVLPSEPPAEGTAEIPAGDTSAIDSPETMAVTEENPDANRPLEAGGTDNNAFQNGFNMDSLEALKFDDVLNPNFNMTEEEPEDQEEDTAESNEFSIPDLDALLADAARGRASNEVEEILLSNEDFARIQKTLATYPLNLRIACEELIAEQAVAPDLMSKLIKSLIQGVPARETAVFAGKILERPIPIPKGFEKRTGEALEAEQARFTYIFVHRFLPVARLFLMIALVAASLFYLVYQFIYTPLHAESIYKIGYERIVAGEYTRANERFREASSIHRVKKWFYRYAEAFRDTRQYIYAEEKYDELLRYYPRDKKGVLDYANMETNYLHNYAKADSLLRRNILDYMIDDKDALLAVGDNALIWGDVEPPRYEDARAAYARLLERYGWTDPVVERMMKYFIRTDNLKEVLPLQAYFMNNSNRKISPSGLAELGGYLLDKKLEESRGVPNEYISYIDGIRDILLKAVKADSTLPEAHYHLARYYNYFGNTGDERITLERAIATFDAAREESVRRLSARIDAERRYAQLLINNREFFRAEEQLVKGVALYEDGLDRRLLSRSAAFGRLYADLGDLEYFTKDGNLELALEYYLRSEQNGWAPPEIQYRMGSAYYHQQLWTPAQERFFAAASEIPFNRRILNALGNVSYMRGDYFIAQGYFRRLLDLLDTERTRFPLLMPNERPDHMELVERLMVARNNMGVTLEALTERTGDNKHRSNALGFYTESSRAWDAITRNPTTMVRVGAGDLATPGINRAFINARNALHPESGYEPQLYLQIDKDVLEPSPWEELAPQTFRLSDNLF
ncbi:MAG: tetratricopeptide repeat protein [Treponema sp.]|jgi:tetratricopeptide (TPR) repeat protein|nr:tetratricopeptide repeat protein [Treponema sp.]